MFRWTFQVRFWVTTLDSVRPPLLQTPYLPPKPAVAEIHVTPSSYREDCLSSASFLLQTSSSQHWGCPTSLQRKKREEVGFYDCLIEIHSLEEKAVEFPSHKLILAASCDLFQWILICADKECVLCSEDSGGCETWSVEERNVSEEDTPQVSAEPKAGGIGRSWKKDGPSLFQRTPECFRETVGNEKEFSVQLKDSLLPGSSKESTITVIGLHVTENPGGCAEAIRALFYFLYTGEIPSRYLTEFNRKILLTQAKAWNIPLLERFLENSEADVEYGREVVRREFLANRNRKLVQFGVEQGLFSGRESSVYEIIAHIA